MCFRPFIIIASFSCGTSLSRLVGFWVVLGVAAAHNVPYGTVSVMRYLAVSSSDRIVGEAHRMKFTRYIYPAAQCRFGVRWLTKH